MRWAKYLWRALNARPFGMFLPPLWFAIAATALVGAFINPAFFMIGGGSVAVATGLIASNARFRQLVDAQDRSADTDTRSELWNRLDAPAQHRQERLEQQCTELQRVLETARAGGEHIKGVWQLAELHLRLLAARSAAAAVAGGGESDSTGYVSAQVKALNQRLAEPDIDADLREALSDQERVLEARLATKNEASRRLQIVDAELDRIREQVALVREQALLTSDPAAIRRSVDSLTTFLNESGRWLKDQEKLFDGIDALDDMPAGPATFTPSPAQPRKAAKTGESQ